ncbi:MAG: CcdB family protein [Mariprofundaceae bacterium]|nr:CcdB family protein [Mariprofundaceae bacterium]
MAQFDVYANPNPASKQHIPYLLDIQAGLLNHLATRVVAPLYQERSIIHLFQGLHPKVQIENQTFILSIAELSAIPLAYLGKPTSNISAERELIISDIDLLVTGV